MIVEDGTIVTGANSYVSRADYIAYALTLGITIADTDAADYQLIEAAEFIDRHEANIKGWKTDRDQPMSFPRNDFWIQDWYWTNEEIPRNVVLCQMAFALDINEGIDIFNPPQNPGIGVKSERVEGVVKVEYAVDGGTGQKLSRSSSGDALLASLLKRNGLLSIVGVRA